MILVLRYIRIRIMIIAHRSHRKGAISVAFVHPSVCLSVAYIEYNSRTQRPSVPKSGRQVPHLRYDSHTSFKVKRSKVKITRPINAHTHRAPYLPTGKAYVLQTWCTDGGRRPASATGAMTSKVKVARSRDQSEPSWPINRKRIVVVSLKFAIGTLTK